MRTYFNRRNIFLFLSSFFILVYAIKDVDFVVDNPTSKVISEHDYLFVLSWSPTYCLENDPNGKQFQCTKNKKYRFIVHGLWPQIAKGQKNSYCKQVDPKLEGQIVEKYFDLMPSSKLMQHQWIKHASCGDFTQKSYFKKIAELYNMFNVTALFSHIKTREAFSFKQLQQEITSKIPVLKRNNFVIKCQKNLLQEIRICLNNDFSLRGCQQSEFKAGRCDLNRNVIIPL